jgi:hypothetical protein
MKGGGGEECNGLIWLRIRTSRDELSGPIKCSEFLDKLMIF